MKKVIYGLIVTLLVTLASPLFVVFAFSETRFDMRNFVPTKPDPVHDNIPKLPLVLISIAFIGAVLLLSRKSITSRE